MGWKDDSTGLNKAHALHVANLGSTSVLHGSLCITEYNPGGFQVLLRVIQHISICPQDGLGSHQHCMAQTARHLGPSNEPPWRWS